MDVDAPPEFGPEFLAWLRETTEAAWRDIQERSLDEVREAGLIGAQWRRGTRWTDPLDDRAIEDVERRFGVRFPAQHRLFLQTLHSTSPAMRSADYRTGELAIHDVAGFYSWLDDEQPVREAMRLVDPSEFADEIDATYGGRRWLDGGPAPQLLPIFGHRYVVADESHLVLSIVGSDAIVYGDDLRTYLLRELDGVIRAGGEEGLETTPAEGAG